MSPSLHVTTQASCADLWRCAKHSTRALLVSLAGGVWGAEFAAGELLPGAKGGA